MEPEERAGKIVRGKFLDVVKPEYTKLYAEVIERAQKSTREIKQRSAGGI